MNDKIFISGILSFCSTVIYAIGTDRPMNILLIMADDFGYECVGANGGESYITPNIDRLADQGIRFNYCYSNPLSTPSRVQLMTGKYNVRNYVSFGRMDRKEVTFGNLLRGKGYATCIAGKWQLGKEKDSPQHFGFEQSCLWQHMAGAYASDKADSRYANPVMEYNGHSVEYSQGEFGPDVACDFIIDFLRKNKERPFFVYYPMILTHCPFVPTPDSKDWNAERSKTYKGNAVYFSDMVSYTDRLVGKIVDELDRLGLRDNTLIIFTGDNGTDSPVSSILHGKPYLGGKGKTIDSGVHIPLIVSCPNGLKGSVNNNLVDFTDFLPTLCDVANVSIPDSIQLDGKSFYSQLSGKETEARKWVYCWYAPREVDHTKAKVFARNKQYKLYRSGEFYDIQLDFEEKKPLSRSSLTKEQSEVYQALDSVIEHYDIVGKNRNLTRD